jgi:hypothetical protein
MSWYRALLWGLRPDITSCPNILLITQIIYKSIVFVRPPLWSNGQRSWLQIKRSWSNSRRYQSLREVVGLERGPLSVVSTTEDLLERKSSDSGLECRKYGRLDPLHLPRETLYPQKVAVTLPTSRGRFRYSSIAD